MGKPLRREVILSKNLILPTTTFFQYGNTSKKKQAFSVWDFQKFRLTPISEGGFGISSLPENIGSGHPLTDALHDGCKHLRSSHCLQRARHFSYNFYFSFVVFPPLQLNQACRICLSVTLPLLASKRLTISS